MIDKLPDNYENALKRTLALRTKAMRNPDLYVLNDTFTELIAVGWMEPVGTCPVEILVSYLPFFVTRTDKPRVVYDGVAMINGMSLNQIVLAGENLLNNLVEVLIRFRLGSYACVADVSKCFFQVGIPNDQQNLFRIVWFKNNDLDKGEPLIFKFTRHVWEINSSPYVALLALKRLVFDNPVNVSELTLNVLQNNRYMDDILFASDNLSELEVIADESVKLFESRGIELRKWVANFHAKSILKRISSKDLAQCLKKIDLGAQPLPDAKALGLTWDTPKDMLRTYSREFAEASTRREMSSQLASLFDPLRMASPFLLGGKLILQKSIFLWCGLG